MSPGDWGFGAFTTPMCGRPARFWPASAWGSPGNRQGEKTMAEQPADIGMIGLGVMGRNLLLNMADRGYRGRRLRPRRRTRSRRSPPRGRAQGMFAAQDLRSFLQRLQRPRAIMLLVPAGEPVDAVIEELRPLLERDDLIIDGGNSHLPRHRPAPDSAGAVRPALPRHGRLRRRVGGPSWPEHDARRQQGGLGAGAADLRGCRGQGRRRPLRHLARSRFGRPLRQDGAQRHRVRR